MKTTITATEEATPTAMFSGQIASYRVKNANSTGSTVNLCVKVTGIHATGEYDTLQPGDVAVYRAGFKGITAVVGWQETSGTCVAYHGKAASRPFNIPAE